MKNTQTWMLHCFLLATLMGFSGISSALEPLTTVVQKVELVMAGARPVRMPFKWSTEPRDPMTGYLDIGLGSEFSDHFTISDQEPKLSLNINLKKKDAQIRVRQRSVTYLNVSGEGPHIAIGGTDVASSWIELKAQQSTVFQVTSQVPQKLNMTRSQILAAIKKTDPDWVELAKTCASADGGACYTVTDTEFEISIKKGNAISSKGILRVLYPNGC